MNRRASDIEKGLASSPPAEALAETAPPPPKEPAPLPTSLAGPTGPTRATPELSGRLKGLTLWQQVLVLAVWPFLEQVLNFLVGYVDTALAGHPPLPPPTPSASPLTSPGA
jgi:hypothetical protein